MIQDIAPHIYRNEYRPAPPAPENFLLCYDGRKALVKHDENREIHFLSFREAEKYCGADKKIYSEYTYLFTIDGQKFYLGNLNAMDTVEKYEWEDIQIFRYGRPKEYGFAGITGWQLHRWYQSRKFCGCCGRPMVPDEKERMLRCEQCGQMEYPKICPAVIIGVTHGNRLLLSKYAGREYKRYALIAGFTEIGETIEETVRREVMEEVGLKVKNITYYKSQPWSFSDTLLLGFFCELDGEENITLDREELALAEWFEREEIPAEFDDCSLTNEMMIRFKEGIIGVLPEF